MRLDPQTDYSIRILLYLASDDDRPTSLGTVAEKLQVSRAYVAKLVTCLMKNKMVVSRRGRTGGLRLHRKLSDISVGDVLRAVERSFTLVECEDRNQACSPDHRCMLTTVCKLPVYLRRATASFFAELDGVSLADVMTGPIELRDGLGHPPLPVTLLS